MKALIFKTDTKKLAGPPNSQGMVGAGSLIVHRSDSTLYEAITVRTYMGKSAGASVVRAYVWIQTPSPASGPWPFGAGKAGGCGYHKESAAIAHALKTAGVGLYDDDMSEVDISGTGSTHYEDAFKAIATAVGYEGPMLWVSHCLS